MLVWKPGEVNAWSINYKIRSADISIAASNIHNHINNKKILVSFPLIIESQSIDFRIFWASVGNYELGGPVLSVCMDDDEAVRCVEACYRKYMSIEDLTKSITEGCNLLLASEIHE